RALPHSGARLHETGQHREAGDQEGACRDKRRHLHLRRPTADPARSKTENPRRPVNWRWMGVVLFVTASRWAAAGPIALPIYMEDNHAGSFYWLARQLDLDEEYTLVHFDAHT